MGINCGAMHSDLTQAERDDIMFRFKAGQIDVLVATDIVARGIDIDDILTVINYDVPHDAEDYVHRIGRTARAQRDGRAITFVNEDDVVYFKQIERFLEYEVYKNPMPDGLDPGPEYTERKAAGGRKAIDGNRHKGRKAAARRQPRRPSSGKGADKADKTDNKVRGKRTHRKGNG